MQLNERPYGETIVVDIHGPVQRECGDAVQLAVSLKRLVTLGYKVILLNVAELTVVDSLILGAIAQAHTTAIRSGASLKLVNVGDRLRELLEMTKLDRFIQTVESEDAELKGSS
jgi:anti-anti-sigma factor